MLSRIAGIETIYYMLSLSFLIMCVGCIPAFIQPADMLKVKEEQQRIELQHRQQLLREYRLLSIEDVGRLA